MLDVDRENNMEDTETDNIDGDFVNEGESKTNEENNIDKSESTNDEKKVKSLSEAIYLMKYFLLRKNVNIVKPEFYQVSDRIKAELHCNATQAPGAVTLAANGLFGRSWKSQEKVAAVLDFDTA